MKEMLCIVDSNLIIQYVSPSLLKKSEYPDISLGKKVIQAIHPDDLESIYSKFIHLIKEFVVFKTNVRIRSSNGAWIPIGIKAIPLLDIHKNVQTILFLSSANKANYETNISTVNHPYCNVNVMLFSMNLETGEHTLTGDSEKMFGFTKEEFNKNPFIWRKHIHPEDAFKAIKAIKQTNLLLPSEFKYRVIHPNGQIKWIHSKTIPIADRFRKLKRVESVAIEINNNEIMDKHNETSEKGNGLIVTVNSEGFITNCSLNVFPYFFRNPLEKKSFTQFFDKEQQLMLQPYFHEAFNGKQKYISVNYKSETGIQYKLFINVNPIMKQSEVQQLLCEITYKNIYKEIKKQLRNQENTIKKYVTYQDIGLWYISMDEELQVVTKGIEKLTGYTVKEFSDNKRLWVNNVYPDDMLLLKENESILLSGSPLRQIYRIKTKKGEIKWVEENVFPTLDSYGNIEYVEGIVLDITEQKLKQEPNFNGVILTTVDLNGRFTSVSEQAAKLTGYTVQELYSMSYRDLLPEEEVKKVDDCFYNAIKGLDIQNRLISMKTKEQEIINVHVIGLPILQNGEIVGLYIITTDLSYHLQLEKNLLFSKPDFYQNYNTVNIGILVSEFNHPSESKILEANDFICNFLQYTHEEIQTKTFDDFALSHHNPVKAFSKNGGEYFHYRAVLLNKNGEKINVYLYNHLIQWNNHSAILSLVNPISNDEKTDSLLKDSGQRLRMLMAELNINTAELAHMTNLTPATISNLRTGKVKKPNIETANKISDALGVPVSHIWMDVNY